jgi:hypothetical protein
MPYTVTFTAADVEYTQTYFPASSTRPVRSNTPLPTIVVPYSMYSLAATEPEVLAVLKAILIVAAVALVLVTDMLNTEYVFAGTVYTEVSVVALSAVFPNLPVAIIYFSVIISA